MIATIAAMALAAAAQDVRPDRNADDPVAIDQRSYRPIGFVPDGWTLYDKVDGDLNGDGRGDSVLVIRRNDPAGVIRNTEGLGMPVYDSNPRTLLVILADEFGQYHLAGRNDAIIPDHDAPTISDPYESIAIEDGKLYLDLTFFANAGSWTTFNRQFQFRWNGEAMALIGFDMTEVHRGSGEMQQTSVNYLTGKRQDGAGSIEDSETDWRWSDLPANYRPVLEQIGNGFEFAG